MSMTDFYMEDLPYFETIALEMGVQKAKIIDTNTIYLGEWAIWKCRYGCPMYARDACHQPEAPGIVEMQRMLSGYHKALLINGYEGPELSRIALKLEHEANKQGYYKAFALIALPFSKGST